MPHKRAKEISKSAKSGSEPVSSRRLPNEVLQLIARQMTSHSSLAACTLASKGCLEIFGPELYRSVTLEDIRHRPGNGGNRFRRLLLSFVEVLLVHGHDDRTTCTNIGKLCIGLRYLIWNEATALCGKSQSCQCLAADRHIKVVLRDRISPLISFSYRMLSGNLLGAIDSLAIEYAPRDGPRVHPLMVGGMAQPYIGSLGPITANAPLSTLSLVFKPVVRDSLKTVYGNDEEDQPDKYCVFDSEPKVDPHGTVPQNRYDLCSRLAETCLSVSTQCGISIVNIDQFPTWTERTGYYLLGAVRSSNGMPMRVVDLHAGHRDDVSNIDSSSHFGTVAPRDESERREIEVQLEERSNLVKDMTRRWMGAVLRAIGQEDTLEDRRGRIQWMSLKEYLDVPGCDDEWFNYRGREEWI